jgi:SAM-dependent methyltransferase
LQGTLDNVTQLPIDSHVRDWNELAELDPIWAVLHEAPGDDDRWQIDDFFATGVGEVSGALDHARELGRPQDALLALDFGCGLGRLTRALADRFERCIGVDVSETMIAAATRLNADRPNCEFVLNTRPDLGAFETGSFDLVYSSIVLQHLPAERDVERLIGEFVRLISPSGIAIFQMPSAISIRYRLQPRRRMYAAARRVGIRAAWLLAHGLNPIRVRALAEDRVRRIVEQAGGRVELALPDSSVPQLPGRRYFVTAGRRS